jgi:hypothetical protein
MDQVAEHQTGLDEAVHSGLPCVCKRRPKVMLNNFV